MALWNNLGRAFGFGGNSKAVNLSAPTATSGAFGGMSGSGVTIDQSVALTNSVFFAAVKVLSEDVAKLPLRVMRDRKDGGRDVYAKHPLQKVFQRPNRWQTPFEFIEFTVFSLVVRGNSYAVILRDSNGKPVELIPLNPGNVTLLTDVDGDIWYQIGRSNQHEQAILRDEPLTIPARDMLHIRGLSRDALTGMSILEQARESLGLAIATDRHGARLFAGGARPSGVLKTAGKLSADATARLKASWDAAHGGVMNFGKTVVLEDGLEYQTIAMTSQDAEWLASRKFAVEEIARFFRIPPHMLQSMERSTFNNIEHQQRSYYDQTLMSWLERIESAINTKFNLLDEGCQAEFDTRRLLRADIKSRYEAYAIARQWGWKSANDVLREEGENPIGEDGDIYLIPMNMIPASQVLNPPEDVSQVADDLVKSLGGKRD
jgi:HK97 family phage portal protein